VKSLFLKLAKAELLARNNLTLPITTTNFQFDQQAAVSMHLTFPYLDFDLTKLSC
jgi:hypothetical protein